MQNHLESRWRERAEVNGFLAVNVVPLLSHMSGVGGSRSLLVSTGVRRIVPSIVVGM